MLDIKQYLATKPQIGRAVVAYPIQEFEVILGLRKKVSIGLGDHLIAGIGGKVGDVQGFENESDEEAMIREVKEEIQITTLDYQYMGEVVFLFPSRPQWNQQVSVYNIYQWHGEPQETSVIKPLQYKINNLPFKKMWDDNQYWTSSVLAGQKIKGFFLYDESNSKVIEKKLVFFK